MFKKVLLVVLSISAIAFPLAGYACDEHKAQKEAAKLEPAAGEEHKEGDGHAHGAPDSGDDHHQNMTMKEVDRKLVSMTINKLMETPQDSVEANGKTYYGCLPCKDTAAARESVDPISGKPVDKATAFLGAAPDGSIYYFENEENLHTFGSDPSRYLNPVEVEP